MTSYISTVLVDSSLLQSTTSRPVRTLWPGAKPSGDLVLLQPHFAGSVSVTCGEAHHLSGRHRFRPGRRPVTAPALARGSRGHPAGQWRADGRAAGCRDHRQRVGVVRDAQGPPNSPAGPRPRGSAPSASGVRARAETSWPAATRAGTACLPITPVTNTRTPSRYARATATGAPCLVTPRNPIQLTVYAIVQRRGERTYVHRAVL
jgi:hypothetical protein